MRSMISTRKRRPIKKLDAFYALLNSSHPEKMARAMLNMAGTKKVPRSVTFYTKPKGRASAKVKEAFRSLNNKVFRSVLATPDPERSRIAENKLNAFTAPDDLSSRPSRPSIVRIDLDPVKLPSWFQKSAKKNFRLFSSLDKEALNRKYILLRIFAKNMSSRRQGKIYLKFEQSGKLQVGKFVLGERVANIRPKKPPAARKLGKGVSMYEVYLNGPLSPITGVLLESAVEFGGEFQVELAASRDGRFWSSDRSIKFEFEDEKIFPPQ